jgi:hypothetical protein
MRLMTNIPRAFLNEYFYFYEVAKGDARALGRDARFRINLEAVSAWLGTNKGNLMKTLVDSYKENRDYVVSRGATAMPGKAGRPVDPVFLSYDAFRLLCMQSKAPKADEVRRYFLALDDTFDRYHDTFLVAFKDEVAAAVKEMTRKRTKDGPGFVYAMPASPENDEVNKPGSTKDLLYRLSTYNTGLFVDRKYAFALRVNYRQEVEACLKRIIRSKRARPRREVYEVDLSIMAKLIQGCDELSEKLHALNPTERAARAQRFYLVFLSDEQVAQIEELKERRASGGKVGPVTPAASPRQPKMASAKKTKGTRSIAPMRRKKTD